jgi:hypothetical protein
MRPAAAQPLIRSHKTKQSQNSNEVTAHDQHATKARLSKVDILFFLLTSYIMDSDSAIEIMDKGTPYLRQLK